MKKTWGFDTHTIDKHVKPQDDFYRYANGAWLTKTRMPEDEARWGSFIILRHETEQKLRSILETLTKRAHLPLGSPEQLVRDFFASGMDMKTRNWLGVEPLEKWRALIHNINSHEDLLEMIARMHIIGVGVLWGAMVDQDSKNSARYALHLFQGGLGLPDREYYLKDEPEFKRVREAYLRHIKNVLILLKKTPAEIDNWTKTIMEIETHLARISMKKEDTRDVEKTYHKKTLKTLQKETPAINWKRYFALIEAHALPYLIVLQPEFLKGTEKLLSGIPLEAWKMYLEWHLIDGSASALSEPFVEENFNFYGRVLTGSKKMKPLWRRALAAVNGTVGEALGKLYVAKYFTERAKRKMDLLVDDLFAAYAERIRHLDWMTPSTKKKALVKLKQMQRKIGYPSRFKTYAGLKVLPDDYFGNTVRAAEHEHVRTMRKLKRPVDRKEWFMTPQTVNAYCNFNMNEVVFPAAILQAPFFDLSFDDAVNYGAIGYTIGHELTHGFDDQGSKFDGTGNMKRWWTEKDRALFEKKAKILELQFNTYKVTPDVSVNGKLTLGENIADLGGLAIAYDAYQKRLKKTGRKMIAGFTPEERFFFGFAQQERELARPEFLKMLALNDPHSPAEFRVNGPTSNFEPFYETFKVKKGQKLYREPKERAKIW
ncbi:hypothetical protein A2841_02950 [Candidatus Kaiserbacteria bacterium RIFCSPHIGHO2_01_FULL_48_10]|uniref:Peptidase M13 n=1 Tax=Candidatus Kaiserbacteria bacterium RIFCSPHIGHO2_01_FULL_48_10 TaxID=1798476 RepID=A0A1F6C166_9BACT|nr:MAG: hypothetical protein A2841_02950 [Candidatus Kaiserbacteria bacterium RIFCSPHIGHO2_01_FULL_48_10]